MNQYLYLYIVGFLITFAIIPIVGRHLIVDLDGRNDYFNFLIAALICSLGWPFAALTWIWGGIMWLDQKIHKYFDE